MTTYRYNGVQTAIGLPPEKEGETGREVQLIPGELVELPAEMPYVQRLIQKGLLELVDQPTTRKRKAQED